MSPHMMALRDALANAFHHRICRRCRSLLRRLLLGQEASCGQADAPVPPKQGQLDVHMKKDEAMGERSTCIYQESRSLVWGFNDILN
jgi:hypothetical protein